MSVVDLKARVSRLEALARGLVKDSEFWVHEQALLLPQERQTYANAVLDALAGVEQARQVLAGVFRRLEAKQPRCRAHLARQNG